MKSGQWRVTDRDLEWLEWMSNWRFVTSSLITREFSGRGKSAPPTVVDRRLRALSDLGLVAYERVLADVPRLYWITREGMRSVGVEGAVVEPKLSDIRHDLLVHEVAHWLATTRARSHRLVTEREIRRTEWPNQHDVKSAVYSIPLPERRTNARAYPDLVSVNEAGRAWGHEVECSRKDHRRLVRLMLGYTTAEAYAGAVYYGTVSGPRPTLESVKRAAVEANRIAFERSGRRPIHVTAWTESGPKEGDDE